MHGSEKEVEEDDPMELVGVMGLPGMTEEDEREMHRCIVEEYVRMRLPDAELMNLFRNPFYRATHQIWRQKGEAYIVDLIQRARSQWAAPASEAE